MPVDKRSVKFDHKQMKRMAKRNIKKALKKHKKNLKGNFFIRTCTLQMIANRTDVRVYETLDNGTVFETEEDARKWYDATVNATRGDGIAVQLFTKDNRIMAECLALYPKLSLSQSGIAVSGEDYKSIVLDIIWRGKGYSWSKDKSRREIRLYEGKPREFHAGLPLRPLINIAETKLTNLIRAD